MFTVRYSFISRNFVHNHLLWTISWEGMTFLQLALMLNYKAMQGEQLIKASNSYTCIHGHDLRATCKRYRESQHAGYSEKGSKSWVPRERTDWWPRRWHFPSLLIFYASLPEITVILFLRIVLFYSHRFQNKPNIIYGVRSAACFWYVFNLNRFAWNFIKIV